MKTKFFYGNLYRIPSLIVTFFLFMGVSQCSRLLHEQGPEEPAHLIAGLLLGDPSCVIGKASFLSRGLKCQSGQAQGSGTLTAYGYTNDALSIELSFQLLGNDSLIQITGGSAPVENSSAANYFEIRPDRAALTGNTTLDSTALAATQVQTWCLEFHFRESPDHLILDDATCTEKLASAANAELKGPNQSRDTTGGIWGFFVKNARISNVVPSTTPVFLP